MSVDNAEMKWGNSWGLGAGVCPIYCKNPKGGAIWCAGWHQQIKGCLYLYLTASRFFCYLPCGLFILTCVFVCAFAYFNTLCIGSGGCFPRVYCYLAYAPLRNIVQGWQFLNQAPCLLCNSFLPELQRNWQGVPLIQSYVNLLPVSQPAL